MLSYKRNDPIYLYTDTMANGRKLEGVINRVHDSMIQEEV